MGVNTFALLESPAKPRNSVLSLRTTNGSTSLTPANMVAFELQPSIIACDVDTNRLSAATMSSLDLSSTEKDKSRYRHSVTQKIYHDNGKKFALRFTVYHRLSLLVILPNAAIIIHQILQGTLFNQPATCIQAVAANVAAAVLVRQDHIINMLFTVFGLIPHWTPLWLRKHAAKLYHLGGIHSGAGVASGMWLVFFNVASIRTQPHTGITGKVAAIITLCFLMDILLLQILVLSIPSCRSKFHNVWEMTHRFSGWMLLIVFWGFLIMYNMFEAQEMDTSLVSLFCLDPTFWLLTITTASVVLSWLSLRKVRPRTERLSSHAVRMHFTYTTVGPCRTPRFSTSPLTEWHSFASIPNFYSSGYSIIISRAGDWTGKIIDNPPTTLWTRGAPACGVLYMAKIFRKILCVGTGSGIAPILGLLVIPGLQFRILWSTPSPEQTFGANIIRRVVKADPRAVIRDTRHEGRPDLIAQAIRLYEEEGDIEAVYVISNAKVTAEVVFGLEARGIPAFAPIFDS